MPTSRRAVAIRLIAAALLLVTGRAGAFGFEDVAAKAQQLAGRPFQRPEPNLPRELAELDYNQYGEIRYKPQKGLWHDTKLPFEVRFLHPGHVYQQPVKVNVVSLSGVVPAPFKPDDFDYGNNPQLQPQQYSNLDFSGFAVYYPLHEPDSKDEVLSFQGASYFRALGEGQRSGQAARGLAIDTGLMSGEEFPAFKEFWIVWPTPEAQHLVIYALLDSRRASGAYRFELDPGVSTQITVKARLFLRENVGKLGIAPLNSMFLYGENQPSPVEDVRPEVHDADGLAIESQNGDWTWRPLVDPRRLLITSFAESSPKGFGLLQRDRAFDHYQDLGERRELVPSVWITPKGDWGRGRVELVQIPTPDERNDNIVAYWVPETLPPPGQPLDIGYTMSWQMKEQTAPATAQVVQTRRGRGWTGNPDNTVRMIVDFDGPALRDLPADAKVFAALTIGDNGELLDRQVVHNAATGGWRLMFRFRRNDEQQPLEMRAVLRHDQNAVSETWSYILPAS